MLHRQVRRSFIWFLLLSGCQSDLAETFRESEASSLESRPAVDEPEPEPEPGPLVAVPEPEPSVPAPQPEPVGSPSSDVSPAAAGGTGSDATDAAPPRAEPSNNTPDEDAGPLAEPEPLVDLDAGRLDECPDDPAKLTPGLCGCGLSDEDSDNDETPDCLDGCASDPDKLEPGVCGCGLADDLSDSDGDETPDCIDDCPNGELISEEDVCGCGLTNDPTDSDDDGAPDCIDLCPADPAKLEPGACGCGVVDATDDADSDGTLDCFDGCIDDAEKTSPGACGCGATEEDGDSDGTADCLDECPTDPNKTTPGSCGCELEESPHCAVLQDALVTRYRFDEEGTTVVDAKGPHDGAAVNVTQAGNGYLTLAGGSSDQYVDLPNEVLMGRTDATFEVWFTWSGGNAWQRLFDFGNSDQSEGGQGTGQSYLFLTCAPALRAGMKTAGLTEVFVAAPDTTPEGVLVHAAVVVDDGADTLSLYVDGADQGSVTTTYPLGNVTSINNWLGRSQFSADPEFAGTLDEFRIYDVALDAEQIAFSYGAGSDPTFLE